MKLSLVVVSAGKAKGQTIPVTLSQFVIGRDPECNLRPASALISKRHCALLVKNDQVFIRDFDSTNGTFVNDEPVKGERQLHNQDMLRVGPLCFEVSLKVTTTKEPSRATPKPPTAKETLASDDESVAAMLLSLGDETSPAEDVSDAGKDSVPGGSTVMDIPVPPLPEGTPPKDAKAPDKPSAAATSSAAAKALLDKYARRSRS